MTKVLILSMCAIYVLCVPGKAAGMAVTDAGSYTYYAEQITKLTEQIEQLQKTYENAVITKDGVLGTLDSVTGLYEKALQFKDKLSQLQGLMEKYPNDIDTASLEWIDMLDEDVFGDILSADDIVDIVFQDPRDMTVYDGETDPRWKTADLRYNVKQDALKNIIKRTDDMLKEIPEMMENIQKLSDKLEATDDMKGYQGLADEILIEILKVLTLQLGIGTEFQKTQSLVDYSGIEKDVTQKRIETINKSEGPQVHSQLKEKGISVDDTTVDSTFNDLLEKF